MASVASELQSVSRTGYDDMIIKTVHEKSTVYKLIGQHKRIFRGGFNESIRVEYRALGQTEAVNPDDTINYSTKDTVTEIKIEPRFVVANEMVRWREKQANRGESKIIDIVAYKTDRLMRDYKTKFHQWLYSTVDPAGLEKPPPDSLNKLISAGNLYGLSVADGDAEDWKSTVVAASWAPKFFGVSATDGQQSLSQLINESTFDDAGVTHILCSRDMHTSLGALWLPKHGEFMIDNDTKNLGIENFMFMGIKVVKDYACPDVQIHGIDFKGGLLCMEDPGQPEVDDWFSLKAVGRPRDSAKVVTWVGNFAVNQRRTMFRCAAATIPAKANFNSGDLA